MRTLTILLSALLAPSANVGKLPFKLHLTHKDEVQGVDGDAVVVGPKKGIHTLLANGQIVISNAGAKRSVVTIAPGTTVKVGQHSALRAIKALPNDPIWASDGLILDTGDAHVRRDGNKGPVVRIATERFVVLGSKEGRLRYTVTVDSEGEFQLKVEKGKVHVYARSANNAKVALGTPLPGLRVPPRPAPYKEAQIRLLFR